MRDALAVQGGDYHKRGGDKIDDYRRRRSHQKDDRNNADERHINSAVFSRIERHRAAQDAQQRQYAEGDKVIKIPPSGIV
ncbi:hypothetical protein SDC9_121562 [bioreactor metagenome]|uniref:Uncharacterized protein n=1 Tax=bioreactor metagenome TaxID=1076179 RepID=A0A645CCB8_9ZZZZ